MDIQAFIFDLDGVITNTAELHYHSWKRLADDEGLFFSLELNDRLRGVERRQSIQRILDANELIDLDEATIREWMQRKQDYYIDLLQHLTPEDALPGVREIIAAARESGIKTAIASGSRNVRPVLAWLDMLDLFDALGDANTVVNPKPNRDLFVWIAGRLDVSPAQAVVFEDAYDGVHAAREGGFWTVGLGDHSNVSNAHVYLSSLADTSVAVVLERIESVATPV